MIYIEKAEQSLAQDSIKLMCEDSFNQINDVQIIYSPHYWLVHSNNKKSVGLYINF